MSEGKQLRLGQVARKLNVGRNTIISYLQDKGYEIDSNPNTKIDDRLVKCQNIQYWKIWIHQLLKELNLIVTK